MSEIAKSKVLAYNGTGGMDLTTGRPMDPTMMSEPMQDGAVSNPKAKPKAKSKSKKAPKSAKLA